MDNVKDGIDNSLEEQVNSIDKINGYIDKWYKYYEEKNFTRMEYQYNKIEENLNKITQQDVIDAYKNNCSSESYVVVENNRGNYDYYLCLKCGDKTYETDKSYCDFKNDMILNLRNKVRRL